MRPPVKLVILRPIMDLRFTNQDFVDPPYCGMANAANFCYTELSEEVLSGGRPVSWQGDIQDFIYL